ncbi:cell wall assembly regulator SMI1 [Crossiella equi]|uniref:Cell wall assembly regulator SMI1 n=1 Tax=Crossiella equi TaxID=130796 RepID=A0ABS5AET0_9PSEU|nr:SMI1/KNR4 family protein [Crossiella equi]MBP2474699.1 cell wall assembly regulator SMI1 [Crossiella equi]
MDVAEGWGRLWTWLAESAPTTHELLRPGAAPAEVEDLERRLGLTFSAELRQWWTLCDGTVRTDFAEIFPPFYTPHSTRSAFDAREWRRLRWREQWAEPDAEPEAGTAARSFHPAWVPIAFDGCGDALVVDLRPGPLHGCVLEWDQERSEVHKPEWSSLAVMLTEVADALESGTPVGHSHPTVTPDGRLDWRIR